MNDLLTDPRKVALTAAVRDHAYAHYTEGWDVVIETMSDEEIAALVARCRSTEGAIRKVWQHIEPWVQIRGEHQAEIDRAGNAEYLEAYLALDEAGA